MTPNCGREREDKALGTHVKNNNSCSIHFFCFWSTRFNDTAISQAASYTRDFVTTFRLTTFDSTVSAEDDGGLFFFLNLVSARFTWGRCGQRDRSGRRDWQPAGLPARTHEAAGGAQGRRDSDRRDSHSSTFTSEVGCTVRSASSAFLSIRAHTLNSASMQ